MNHSLLRPWLLLLFVVAPILGLSTKLPSQQISPLLDSSNENYSLLVKHAGQRLESLEDLPRTAEVFTNGKVQLVNLIRVNEKRQCVIQQLSEGDGLQPEETTTIDFNQLITVWDKSNNEEDDMLSPKESSRISSRNKDAAFHALYQSRVGRGRQATLTKKQLNALDQKDDTYLPALRLVLKTGGSAGMPRLVDSLHAAEYLFGSTKKGPRAVAARELGNDAVQGGRFKRFPCIRVSDTLFVNGGWVAVDKSVRAGAEARKFVERQGNERSVSDERIIRRLECLAMGEQLYDQEVLDRRSIEVDVRMTLNTLSLPVTPAGATDALVQMGIWSESQEGRDGFVAAIQPWTKEILEATERFAQLQRRRGLDEESRVDLTSLPCVSIDQRKTRFRDDAVGVRRRSSTGRPVFSDKSKWEVLIHIADVSDIYSCPYPFEEADALDALSVLREAAMRRGSSRYDLAYGPLHLLPPTALKTLTLDESQRSVTIWVYIDEQSGKIMDSGVERTLISSPVPHSFEEASRALAQDSEDNKLRPLFEVISRILTKWKSQLQSNHRGSRKRSQRMDANCSIPRSPGHLLVDSSLDLYSHVASTLLWRARAPVPKSLGATITRGGRFATGPLRRAIDGQAQRQLLAVCCGFGDPLSFDECKDVSRRAVASTNAIANVRSVRR